MKKSPYKFLQLTEAGIAKKLYPAQLNEFLGGFSKLGSVQQQQEEMMIDPSMGHLRQVINFHIKNLLTPIIRL